MIVAVYCSANNGISDQYKRLGDQLGTWLARHGHTLLYGGATGGLMSRVSDAAKAARGHVIGVVPTRIIDNGRLASNCDELYTVATMSERKQLMRDKADVFVCLPGSYGTLDEMFDVIASGTVGEHQKPLYILNYDGFYDCLLQECLYMRQQQFLPKEDRYAYHIVNTMEELFTILSTNLN